MVKLLSTMREETLFIPQIMVSLALLIALPTRLATVGEIREQRLLLSLLGKPLYRQMTTRFLSRKATLLILLMYSIMTSAQQQVQDWKFLLKAMAPMVPGLRSLVQ